MAVVARSDWVLVAVDTALVLELVAVGTTSAD